MKLSTVMLRGPDGMTITAGYSEGKYSAREHYAACAHALMQAINAWAARRSDHASYADHLTGHADQLMANWGFDSGEVDSGH